MKKLLLLTALFSSLVYGQEYTKGDRIKDMVQLAKGMGQIQEGMLYRCEDGSCIVDGINTLKAGMKHLDKVNLEDYLPQEQRYAYKFAKKTTKMINMYLDEMEENVDINNKYEVAENYYLIFKQCNSCHIRLRK